MMFFLIQVKKKMHGLAWEKDHLKGQHEAGPSHRAVGRERILYFAESKKG